MKLKECIGKVMSKIWLNKLMGKAFTSVSKMFLGEKFPTNMHVLGFFVMEVLRDVAKDVESFHNFDNLLNGLASKGLALQNDRKIFHCTLKHVK